MEALSQFLHMGGYGGFVWPAYVLAVVVMVALYVFSVRTARKAEADLSLMQQLRQDRRRNRES